jgi:hypothetical protein
MTHVRALAGPRRLVEDGGAMDTDRARAVAEQLHSADREEDGTPLLAHIRRVVLAVPAEARPVAWLHEVLEWTLVPEQALLENGLTTEELRTLRLLDRTGSRSDRVYLGHLRLIARAAGRSGDLARLVKTADLEDRCRHPRVRADGWSPPYALGLILLQGSPDDWDSAVATTAT